MKPTIKVIPYTPGDTNKGPMLPGNVAIEYHWEGVDRPCSYCIICRARHVKRLMAACEAGVLFKSPEVKTDVNGKTYVDAICMVSGRHINADLKRLGY